MEVEITDENQICSLQGDALVNNVLNEILDKIEIEPQGNF